MKNLNPYETSGLVSPIYCGAKAPFFICHSTEEFNTLVGESGEPYRLIKDVLQFTTLVRELGMIQPSKNYSLEEHNVWIATGEIFIPEEWTSIGMILYKLVNNKPVPTDNCYIRIYGFVGYSNMFTIATSAGLYNISAMLWDISAAVKTNFHKVNPIIQKSSEEKAKKFLENKRPMLADLRFVYYTLFADMDEYTAAKKAYGNFMSKERTDRLRNTERIKNLIVKELGVIIPNLAEEILKEYPVNEMAKDMKSIVKKTLEAKDFSHKDAKEAMEFILDNSVKAQSVLTAPQAKPLTEGAKVEQIGETVIHTMNGDLSSITKRKKDPTEEATVLDSVTKAKIEDELAVPRDGYSMGGNPDFKDPAKLFPDDIDARL